MTAELLNRAPNPMKCERCRRRLKIAELYDGLCKGCVTVQFAGTGLCRCAKCDAAAA